MLYAARSHIGLVRHMNQDSYAVHHTNQWTLLIIADGMGGASAGEVASRMATDIVLQDVTLSLDVPDIDAQGVLRHAVHRANKDILDAARRNIDYLGMGTTLVVALFNPHHLYLAHIGDSRAYRIHSGRLEQITRDHSLVAELVRKGQITEDEAQHHPQRNIVTRSLGTAVVMPPDVEQFPWSEGDVLLLCTDGLTNLVPAHELEEVLATLSTAPMQPTDEELEQAADNLIQLALSRGGPDNVTLILAVHRREFWT